MGNDEFSEVTSRSWFGRIGNSIKGILFGAILILASVILLFWNEGRAVKRYRLLKEGAEAVVSIPSAHADPSNNGKLVHLTGLAVTDEMLSDKVFGISDKAIKLRRLVQMYQWDEEQRSETTKKLGGGEETKTTYSYHKKWSDSPIDSSRFKQQSGHENPSQLLHQSTTFTAHKVSLGAFTLSSSLLNMMNSFEPLQVEAQTPAPQGFTSTPDGFYGGKNAAQPEIGDVKISFQVVKPTHISIVTGQHDSVFEPFTFDSGDTIELLETGTHSAKEMFRNARSENNIITWILRAAGFILMLMGFGMIFKLLSVLADVIPFLGDLVSVGTGFIALLLSFILSLVTIAIAWFFFRPLYGILLLAAAGLIGFFLIKRTRAGKIAAQA